MFMPPIAVGGNPPPCRPGAPIALRAAAESNSDDDRPRDDRCIAVAAAEGIEQPDELHSAPTASESLAGGGEDEEDGDDEEDYTLRRVEAALLSSEALGGGGGDRAATVVVGSGPPGGRRPPPRRVSSMPEMAELGVMRDLDEALRAMTANHSSEEEEEEEEGKAPSGVAAVEGADPSLCSVGNPAGAGGGGEGESAENDDSFFFYDADDAGDKGEMEVKPSLPAGRVGQATSGGAAAARTGGGGALRRVRSFAGTQCSLPSSPVGGGGAGGATATTHHRLRATTPLRRTFDPTARPGRSSMKRVVSTASIASSASASIGRSAAEDASSSSQPTAMRRNSVSFASLEIREYEVTLGDNPSVSSGPPVTIGWTPQRVSEHDLEEYELRRKTERRKRHQMLMSHNVRWIRLMREQGVTTMEIKGAMAEAERVRRQRRDTVTHLKVAKLEEALESAERKVKRLFKVKKKMKS